MVQIGKESMRKKDRSRPNKELGEQLVFFTNIREAVKKVMQHKSSAATVSSRENKNCLL